MMSKCTKQKRVGGDGISLNSPFIKQWGGCGKVLHVALTTQTFFFLNPPCLSVQSALSSCPSHCYSVLCCVPTPPHPSLSLPTSVNICSMRPRRQHQDASRQTRPPVSLDFAPVRSSKRLSTDKNIFCFKAAAPSSLSLVDSMYWLEMFLL